MTFLKSTRKIIDIDLSFLESDFNQDGGNMSDSFSIHTEDFVRNDNKHNISDTSDFQSIRDNQYGDEFSATSDSQAIRNNQYGGGFSETSDFKPMINNQYGGKNNAKSIINNAKKYFTQTGGKKDDSDDELDEDDDDLDDIDLSSLGF